MQPLERAVAIFCIACICAELTTQLAGTTPCGCAIRVHKYGLTCNSPTKTRN